MPVATPTLTITDLGTGTTATATVSGSTGGTTNTLYYQPVADRGGSWTSAGSRSGDGTIDVTSFTAGYYWWYLLSTDGNTNAISGLVYQPVLNDQASVHYRCQQAVIARLQELTISGIDTDHIYDQGFVNLDNLDKPCILVAMEGPPETELQGTNARDDICPGILVVVVMDGAHKSNAWTGSLTKVREQCWRALIHQRAEGVTECNTCQIEFDVPLNLAEKNQDVLYSAFVARYENRLTRGLT